MCKLPVSPTTLPVTLVGTQSLILGTRREEAYSLTRVAPHKDSTCSSYFISTEWRQVEPGWVEQTQHILIQYEGCRLTGAEGRLWLREKSLSSCQFATSPALLLHFYFPWKIPKETWPRSDCLTQMKNGSVLSGSESNSSHQLSLLSYAAERKWV